MRAKTNEISKNVYRRKMCIRLSFSRLETEILVNMNRKTGERRIDLQARVTGE